LIEKVFADYLKEEVEEGSQ
jgi:hypothetical protein